MPLQGGVRKYPGHPDAMLSAPPNPPFSDPAQPLMSPRSSSRLICRRVIAASPPGDGEAETGPPVDKGGVTADRSPLMSQSSSAVPSADLLQHKHRVRHLRRSRPRFVDFVVVVVVAAVG